MRGDGRLRAAVRADDDARHRRARDERDRVLELELRLDASAATPTRRRSRSRRPGSTTPSRRSTTPARRRWANAVPSRTITLTTGDASYYGTLTGSTWKLVGIGTVRNPTGPGSEPVVRTVSGRASARLRPPRHRRTTPSGTTSTSTTRPSRRASATRSTSTSRSTCAATSCCRTARRCPRYALQVMGHARAQQHRARRRPPALRCTRCTSAGGCRLGSSGSFTKPCGAAQRVHATISDSTPTNVLEAARRPERVVLQLRAGPAPSLHERQLPRRLRQRLDPEQQPRHGQPDARAPPTTAASTTPPVRSSARSPGTRRTQALTLAGTIYFDGPITFRQYNNARSTPGGRRSTRPATSPSRTRRRCAATRSATRTGTRSRTCSRSCPAATSRSGNLTGFQGAIYAVNDYTEYEQLDRSGGRSSRGASRSRTQA